MEDRHETLPLEIAGGYNSVTVVLRKEAMHSCLQGLRLFPIDKISDNAERWGCNALVNLSMSWNAPYVRSFLAISGLIAGLLTNSITVTARR